MCKNYNLFRPDVSVYEIMSGASPTVALTEHFRCNPEIINYCNRLCYNNRIKPLKVVKSDDLAPSVINYNVQGKRSVNGKTNTIEALYTVALIQACIEQKEYEGKTIGIIPMLGNEQREEIYRILISKISARERSARNIVCGEEKIREDMEREIILNRIGNWEFIRIRGGAYYRDKDSELQKLVDKLSEKNIFPEKVEMEAEVSDNEVFERVKSRAQEIYRQWAEHNHESTLIDKIVEIIGVQDDLFGPKIIQDPLFSNGNTNIKDKPISELESESEPKTTFKPKSAPASKSEPKTTFKSKSGSMSKSETETTPNSVPNPKPVNPYNTKLIKDKGVFVVGKKVWHKTYGDGVVVKAGVLNVTVQFEKHEENFFANNAIKKEEYFEYE